MLRAPGLERRLSDSEEETRSIGRELAARLPVDGVLLLSGDLGTGKTVLTQGVGEALGVEPRQVQSPSYTLIREHEGREGWLIHVDLYRLEAADLPSLGLEEILAGAGVKVVEWSERLDFEIPGAWRVGLERGTEEGERIVTIEPGRKRRINV